jgi:hypothetical protein
MAKPVDNAKTSLILLPRLEAVKFVSTKKRRKKRRRRRKKYKLRQRSQRGVGGQGS